MEQKNDTSLFNQKDKKEGIKNHVGELAGAAVAGAALGAAVSAFAHTNTETIPNPEPEQQPEPNPAQEPDLDTEPSTKTKSSNDESQPKPVSDSKSDPEPVPNPDPEPVPNPDPDPDSEPELDPEPEPILPIEEIDPNDIDVADVIEDVTNIEVVYDVNGNEMVVATAHNSTDGDFYLVDADNDGDFDVVLDNTGTPVADLTGDFENLVTVTDVEAKMTEGYIPPTEIDKQIAQNSNIGENISDDIVVVDDTDIS